MGSAGGGKWGIGRLRAEALRAAAVLIAVVYLGLTGIRAPAHAQSSPNHIFTVANYPVEGRAADAVKAKAIAMAEGEQAAFRSLLKRLVPVTAYARLRKLTLPKVSNLLDGVAVRSERNSSTEYLASLDFSFNPQAVRALLEREGLPYADSQAPQIIVVPVWQTPLEAGPNAVPPVFAAAAGTEAWTSAWKSLDLVHTLTPVKLAKLSGDISADTAKALAGGKLDLLRSFSQAHGSDLVVLAFAEPDLGTKKLNVTLVGQDSRGVMHWSRAYRIDGGDAGYTIELAAVISLGVIEGRWKMAAAKGGRAEPLVSQPLPPAYPGQPAPQPPAAAAPSLPAASGGLTTLFVEFRGPDERAEMFRRISTTPGLEDVDVVGMNQRSARLTTRYSGAFLELQRALEAQGLQLRNANGQWTIAAQ